jgi:hypothetical protein
MASAWRSPLRVNFPKTFKSESSRPEGCLSKLCPHEIGVRHAALSHKFSENMGHSRIKPENGLSVLAL